MNYSNHFEKVKSFLSKHHYIFDVEVLKRYPEDIEPYYLNLSREIINLSNEELALFESNINTNDKFSEELNSLLSEIKNLIEIPCEDIKESMLDKNLSRKLNPKKKHELSTLKTLFDNSETSIVFDIGGGVGHLSNIFVANQDKEAICIDMNKDFIESGKLKIKRWLPSHMDKVKFINKKIGKSLELNLTDSSLIAGLHSCGSLSVDIVKYFSSKKTGKLLNFGCCYHQLGKDYNISEQSKINPLNITNNALHLATRSYAYTTEVEVIQRRSVKMFRYALHHLGMKYFNDEFITLGNGKKEDYNGDFSSYVYKYYKKSQSLSKDEIETFYKDESIQTVINENFYLDFIRALFGRVIEVYLLLDRALYLEESGVSPKLIQIFDRKLSPRNIGIIA